MTIKQLQDVYAPVVVSSGAMSGRDERLELCLRVSAGSLKAGASAAWRDPGGLTIVGQVLGMLSDVCGWNKV